MAHRMLHNATAVKVSRPIRLRGRYNKMEVAAKFDNTDADSSTNISALVIKTQGAPKNRQQVTGIVTDPALAIGTTAERYANGAFIFQVNGTTYSKGAVAAGTVFSAAHVVAASKFGCIDIYINASGAFRTVVPAVTQSYTSQALAIAAIDLLKVLPNTLFAYVGRIYIEADSSTWTANTDDMTDGSELTKANFIDAKPDFQDIYTKTFSPAEITAGQALWYISEMSPAFARSYISTITGTGRVTVYITPLLG